MPVIVSIIVPIYKVEQYLNRCVTSLVNQTLKDIEIILVDDGSPDRCPQMCEEWANRDHRIKVVHKKNAGLGYARNSGLEVAKGEYVVFCDSDDSVDTRMYESMYTATEHGKYDVVYCGVNEDQSHGKWVKRNSYNTMRTFVDSPYKVALSFIGETDITEGHRYVMGCWAAMYRRSLLEQYNIRQMSEREVLSEDLIFQLQVAKKARKVKFIPDCYYHYHLNSGSLTHSFKETKFDAAFRIREIMLDIMGKDTLCTRIIDGEFYSRIRSLVTQLLCESDMPFSRKKLVLSHLSDKLKTVSLDTSLILGGKWKYGYLYKLLMKDRLTIAYFWVYFDKYVNKQNLFWWRQRMGRS